MNRWTFLALVIWLVSLGRPSGAFEPAEQEPPLLAALPRGTVSRNSVHPAVVRIVVPGDGSVSYGSGTLVDVNERHGLIITNWHVINEAAGTIAVLFPDGFQSAGTAIKIDRDWDLAAIAIWRPNVPPVSLAQEAPRPGEVLTIAGYGSGNYRMASGECTQYVAPGLDFPYEMVELATTARQGDSGGPIFNRRGELAGVLFGEGHGRTAGSYCGRVRWFLDSLIDQSGSASRQGQTASGGSRLQEARADWKSFDAERSVDDAPARSISAGQAAEAGLLVAQKPLDRSVDSQAVALGATQRRQAAPVEKQNVAGDDSPRAAAGGARDALTPSAAAPQSAANHGENAQGTAGATTPPHSGTDADDPTLTFLTIMICAAVVIAGCRCLGRSA